MYCQALLSGAAQLAAGLIHAAGVSVGHRDAGVGAVSADLAGLEELLGELLARLVLLFLAGLGIPLVRHDADDELVTVVLVQGVGVVHGHGGPGIPAARDDVLDLSLDVAAGVQIGDPAQAVDIAGEALPLVNKEVPAGCDREER